jgi:RNA polymerase sigma-54 factor
MMDFRFEQRQQQTLSPRLQHAVRLLTLSSLDFAQAVQQASGRNPFLEVEEEAAEPGADPDLAAAPIAERLQDADLAVDRDDWQGDLGRASGRLADGEGDEGGVIERVAVEASLAEHLHTQLALQPLDPRERLLARVIVDSLDDDGYLRTTLEELLSIEGLFPPATLEELRAALARVQALEPAGVGARSVAECLLLQLPSIECERTRALAERIVQDHMKALAARDVPALARALGSSVAEVERACDRIRHLDPRPGWRIGASRPAYIVPDVTVRKVRGQWTVRLNQAIVPRVKLNHTVAELFQRAQAGAAREHHAAMADHLQEARWTLRNVEQRFSTILDVARAIVRRQKHFLDFGPMAMKPMALRDIAEEIGVHESTVSRVTNNKYIATPSGVFELKYFFSRPMRTASGSACSGTAIRGLVKDMIEAEQPHAPLSDAEIARQLARQGLKVARRTVTKYRQGLRIEAVERRRRHA